MMTKRMKIKMIMTVNELVVVVLAHSSSREKSGGISTEQIGPIAD